MIKEKDGIRMITFSVKRGYHPYSVLYNGYFTCKFRTQNANGDF